MASGGEASAKGSPFVSSQLKLRVSILPFCLGGAMASVKAVLNQLLTRYHEGLGGVVLAYSDVKLASGQATGQIRIDEPHIHIDVSASVTLFSPKCGMALVGRIIEVADTHVSVLCYGLFNATIAAPDMGSEYSFDTDLGEWRSDSLGAQLGVGKHVRLAVTHSQHSQGLVALEGKLIGSVDVEGHGEGSEHLSAGTQLPDPVLGPGESEGLDSSAVSVGASSMSPSKAKKRKRTSQESATAAPGEDAHAGDEGSLGTEHGSSKVEPENSTGPEAGNGGIGSVENTPKKDKKKKKRPSDPDPVSSKKKEKKKKSGPAKPESKNGGADVSREQEEAKKSERKKKKKKQQKEE